ncbi:hypothetical protein GUJ93_ZPchr0002g25639 [Zizania palustris]|uniref:Uncharacterized protein n=1 Tax=Zizania palustris TaxID=103762 RepID=A0A8J5RGN0_ZIZPA|nr:hypothetical protein GUJ93_ZPchr0002g25639 [Zizania palustris]
MKEAPKGESAGDGRTVDDLRVHKLDPCAPRLYVLENGKPCRWLAARPATWFTICGAM